MHASRALTIAALAGSFAIGCSSSSSGGDPSTPTDTGTPRDSYGDTFALPDTIGETTSPDTKKSETASDAPHEGGVTSCDGHPGDECNMVKQDCADPTMTCDYDPAKLHNACVANPIGTAGKGESCDPTKNPCDKGLFCYENKCSPACCTGDNSVCGPGGECRLSITDTKGGEIYHACIYAQVCHPFKYDCPAAQVCNFATDPDVFECSTPSSASAYGAAPGIACFYANDCGESQACFSTGATAPDGGKVYNCLLFCWLSGPEAGTVGADAKGRFAANGTCNVGGKSYGTCTSVPGIGGGLGICVP